MVKYGLDFLYIGIGILLLLMIVINLYWGTFILLISQPLFVTVLSDQPGFSVSKVMYGALFAVWFIAWALKPVGRDTAQFRLHYSVRPPALAFGVLLGIATGLGLIYGATPDYVIRDLSQYVGYLAVLPLLDLVRTPKQAKRLIFCLALLGLPCSTLNEIYGIAAKQHLEVSVTRMGLNFAAPYWGPIQGAIWVVAISFQGLAIKMLSWAWLILKSSLSVFSGVRHMLLMFVISALTAFMVSGRIARHSLARYMIPVCLALAVGGLLADLSGMINLPFTSVTRDRYSTLLSEKSLERDESMEGRFRESWALFKLFLQNPVTGIGLGHVLKDKNIPGGPGVRFHNGYIETLMKFGVVGTTIFFWYFLALFRQAFEIARAADNYFAKAIALGVVIWLVPAIIASVAVSYFADRGFALTVGVMAGLLPALTFNDSEEKIKGERKAEE